jgi:hypothetical protein
VAAQITPSGENQKKLKLKPKFAAVKSFMAISFPLDMIFILA